MKRLEIFFFSLVILVAGSLTSCSPGGSASRLNCSDKGEVCITVNPVLPMHFAYPVTIKIQVSSTKDIPNLSLDLVTNGDATVDGPQNWENYLTYTLNTPGAAIWNFPISAGQTLTFYRVLHFPVKDGYIDVLAEVVNGDHTIRSVDEFSVHTAHDNEYWKPETPHPIYTPNVTLSAYGPGTPVPAVSAQPVYPWENTPIYPISPTIPSKINTPIPSQFMPLVATKTPTRTRTPTSRPYPYP